MVVLLLLMLCLAETLVSVNRGMKYTAAKVQKIDEEPEFWLIKKIGIIQNINFQQKFSKSCKELLGIFTPT
jgi:hypothetical protein